MKLRPSTIEMKHKTPKARLDYMRDYMKKRREAQKECREALPLAPKLCKLCGRAMP